MNVVTTIHECRTARSALGRLALVPTMGALHAGHRSLLQRAKQLAEHVAVSIFVNPTQFGPREDYNKYPRPIEDDLAMCREVGVDLVFNPAAEEMYPPQARSEPAGAAGARALSPAVAADANAMLTQDIVIDLPYLTTVLEGRHRPGHFRGVLQVVAKLFNIIRPDLALFGQKDYQQLRILTAMVEALNWPIEMVPCPTVREPDGLAMSSRNRYLSPEERKRALTISAALFEAEAEFKNGIRQANRLVTTVQKRLLAQHLNIDYVAAVDPINLRPVEMVEGETVIAVAARVGATRLIDNVILRP